METRLSKIFTAFAGRSLPDSEIVFKMNRPWTVWRERFSYGIFFLFVGFLLGNLFGTFLPLIRLLFPWDGFIVLIILFCVELISYIRYHKQGAAFLGIWKITKNNRIEGEPPHHSYDFGKDKAIDKWKECNYFKIGFLLGFFIDAYKVGS